MPGTFEKVLLALDDPQYSGVYSNVKFVNGEGAFTRNLIVHRPMKLMSLFHCYIPSTTFFFKREILESGITIDKDMHISMDKDFFANILYGGYKLRFVNDFFASFRWHDSNKSLDDARTKRVRFREGLMILNRYLGVNFPLTSFNIFSYKFVGLGFMVVRKFMKSFNYAYTLRS